MQLQFETEIRTIVSTVVQKCNSPSQGGAFGQYSILQIKILSVVWSEGFLFIALRLSKLVMFFIYCFDFKQKILFATQIIVCVPKSKKVAPELGATSFML